MKWNIEWVDLQNIDHMIAECWRMNERQLAHYCRELLRQQELVFAGRLGKKFLEFLCTAVDDREAVDWSKLQKDIRLMQDMIKDGQEQDEEYWKKQYDQLSAAPQSCFYTQMGSAFTGQLAFRLELDISKEQKLLRQDIRRIKKICTACDWKNDAEIQKTISILTKKEKNFFSSWLGDGFVHLLQERFIKKEEAPVPAPAQTPVPEPEMKTVKKTSRKAKIAWAFVICISAGFLVFWIYAQVQGRSGRFHLQNLISGIKETAFPSKETAFMTGSADSDTASDAIKQDTASDAIKQDTASGTAGQNNPSDAANRNTASGTVDQNTADTGAHGSTQQESAPDILPQYQSFHRTYPDLFGWLKIPGTEIDHPVMQSDDEKKGEPYYYLHRDYTGKRAEAGSLFVENKSSCFPQDDNTVIYGHNMSNGHNFGMLEKYKDRDFFSSHPAIQYDTIYEESVYQIAAVLITRVLYQEEKGFRYYQFYNYHTDSEFQECMDFIKKNQLYDTGIEIAYGDQLLMLSTCEYSRENGRLVIVAKKQQ